MSRYFNLYGNCLFVKGITRSLIADLQRNKYFLVPNSFEEILALSSTEGMEKTEKIIGNKKILHEYFKFLEDNDLGFYSSENEKHNFPQLDLSWDSPFLISNMIVDIKNVLDLNLYKKINDELVELGVYALELRFYDDLDIAVIESILKIFKINRLRHIEVLIKYKKGNSSGKTGRIFDLDNRINTITIHSSPSNRFYNVEKVDRKLVYLRRKFDSQKCCGIAHFDFFTTNILHFTESQHHNTCLNRKISIDVEGNIKNCPSMPKSYGNIVDTKLSEVLDIPDFKKTWNIKKDEITKCKDCEFRHICTDCRAYLETPGDLYSAPLKCGYDPINNTWEEWSINPLKQQAIDFYGIPELVK